MDSHPTSRVLEMDMFTWGDLHSGLLPPASTQDVWEVWSLQRVKAGCPTGYRQANARMNKFHAPPSDAPPAITWYAAVGGPGRTLLRYRAHRYLIAAQSPLLLSTTLLILITWCCHLRTVLPCSSM